MISIVIATFNAADCLEEVLKSILSQDNTNFELVIIDGGSKDSTADIINRYEKYVAYWISEKDNGIYDAWNKGIKQAKGEWIMFLGADDTLMPGALSYYYSFLDNYKDIESLHYLSSKRQMIDIRGNLIRVTGYPWEWPFFLKFMTVSHPGSLHSIKLFEQYGLYNTKFKICGDYELLLRPRDKLKAAFMDKITVNMREGGASDSIAAIREYYNATTSTGGHTKFNALFDSFVAISKFILKKSFRKIGVNVYYKKP